jgi:Ca2+-binding EF-hand superfamily protein
MHEAFTLFDHDQDGKISTADLKFVLPLLDEHATEDEREEMIREAGDSESGIGYLDFLKLMGYTK